MIPNGYHPGMTLQIAVRLPEDQVAFIDGLVASGEARSRAELVSRAVARLQRQHEALRDLDAIRADPYDEFEGLHRWSAERAPERDA